METPSPQVSRRTLLAGGLVGATAAVVGSMAGPALASAAPLGRTRESLVDSTVDLTIAVGDKLDISGTVDGRPVSLKGNLYAGPGQPATVTGVMAGHHLAAILTQSDQVPDGSGYLTTTKLTASIGDIAVALSGSFNLDGNYEFEDGAVSGSDEGLSVKASVVPVNADGNIGYAARVRGAFGGTEVDVLGKQPTGLGGHGSITGKVGGQPIDLGIDQGRQSGNFPVTHLKGTFGGPIELLALLAGVVAYFVP